MLADLKGLVKFLAHVYGSHNIPGLDFLTLSHVDEALDDDEATESESSSQDSRFLTLGVMAHPVTWLLRSLVVRVTRQACRELVKI